MNNNINKNEIKFKLVLLGDSSVGKTTLLNKYITGKFQETTQSNIGIDMKYSIEIIDGKTFKLLIWDTAGQELYKSISKNYYKNSLGILLIYSINNKNSFLNIENWVKEINENKNLDQVVFLIGNKTDLTFERTISYEDGWELAKKYDFKFFETSAKDVSNQENSIEIKEIILKLLREINKNLDYYKNNITEKDFDLSIANEKKSCC